MSGDVAAPTMDAIGDSTAAASLQEIEVLSRAYCQAQDMDIMQTTDINNSAQSQVDIPQDLRYYVVSMTWFRKAAPVLQYIRDALSMQNQHHSTTASTISGSIQPPVSSFNTLTWKEDIGIIQNSFLTTATPTIVSETTRKPPPPFLDELQKKSSLPVSSSMSTAAASPAESSSALASSSSSLGVQPQYRHSIDYVLVGANVWLLLSQKFGFDVVLSVPCLYTRRRPSFDDPSREQLSYLSVRVNNATTISSSSRQQQPCVPIPIKCRFPYEQYLSAAAAAAPLKQLHTADQVASDDDFDDLFPSVDLPDENSTSAAHDIDHDSLSPQNSNVILLPSADGVAKQHATHSVGRDWNMSSNNNTNDNYDDDDIYSNSYDTSSTTVIVRRRFGSGLGNLGNTCFMNSTLQCLAHTQSLQRYFLTGAYIQDLNRDNPLGTGGELATQFAHLLAEMWCSKQQVVNQHGSGNASTTELYTSSTNVVYPKNFKHTLGKHAEQFIGYDQHDSQELATYLLDALHEDCNRVTNKPYIEKPEQTENESDQDASDKAWELHLKREDSRVLENFMGQVKSHVKCCKPECGRVSTTFDPFMFLSVPIPGSEDRSLRFTFVPLNPSVRPMKLSVNVGKAASVEEILKSIIDLLPSTACLPDPSAVPNWTDLIICDLWKKEIFEWINPDGDGEKIRDNDDTFVYQVRPLADIQTLGEKPSDFPIGDAEIAKLLNISDTKRSRHYQLDIAILTRINRGDEWLNEMQKYMRTPTMLMHAFNIRKGTSEDRTRIYHSLTQFLKQCNLAIESDEDPTSQKRNRSDTIDDATNGGSSSGSGSLYLDTVSSVDVKESDQRCDIPSSFDGVKNKHDLAILEFLAGKMFQEIIRLERRKEEIDPNGVVIEVRIRTGNLLAANPFVVRVPCDMTVFGFRLELALRLARCLKTNAAQYGNRLENDVKSIWNDEDAKEDSTISPTNENGKMHTQNSFATVDAMNDSSDVLLLRRIPMSYSRKSVGNRSYFVWKQLGSLDRAGNCTSISSQNEELSRGKGVAQRYHAEEAEIVADLVGEQGHVFLDILTDRLDEGFDLNEYQSVYEQAPPEAFANKKSITVQDCIEKFCQMEQLEASEQWYCSRCKAHVRAWKQFHIYRSPPHLIVHLKRFQFSARTHRRQKIGVHIDFPLEGLDLTNQVLHWTDDEKPIYDCYAVSNHYGGLGGGHYTAYALNDGGVWCHYDDSRISSNVDVSEVVSQAAYVLYYRRRDIPVNVDFQMSMCTPESELRMPSMIENTPLIAIKLPHREPSEISSNAAMVDDDEVMEDTTENGSRSTSPASVDFAQQEYATSPFDEFNNNGDNDENDDDDGGTSIPSSMNKSSSSSLPLLQ